MADRPLRRNHPSRRLAERSLRIGIVIGAVAGWCLVVHAVRVQLAAGG